MKSKRINKRNVRKYGKRSMSKSMGKSMSKMRGGAWWNPSTWNSESSTQSVQVESNKIPDFLKSTAIENNNSVTSDDVVSMNRQESPPSFFKQMSTSVTNILKSKPKSGYPQQQQQQQQQQPQLTYEQNIVNLFNKPITISQLGFTSITNNYIAPCNQKYNLIDDYNKSDIDTFIPFIYNRSLDNKLPNSNMIVNNTDIIRVVCHSGIMDTFIKLRKGSTDLFNKKMKNSIQDQNLWSILLEPEKNTDLDTDKNTKILITRHAFTGANLEKEKKLLGVTIRQNIIEQDTSLTMWGIITALIQGYIIKKNNLGNDKQI